MLRTQILLFSAALATGCATTLLRESPNTAQGLYEVAMQDLEDGMYAEALTGFNVVKTKFPYSKFAALADLRMADTHFERGKMAEAIDGYRMFLKYHPSHTQGAYAMYRIGESYFEQIPSDWWFLPPSAEKDQASTRLAISAFRDLLARYQRLEHREEGSAQIAGCHELIEKIGQEKSDESVACRDLLEREDLLRKGEKQLEKCRRKLADHEMYVADFYFKRERYDASAARAEGVLKNYGGLGLDEAALWVAARSHVARGTDQEARQALLRLIQEFPTGSIAPKASAMLETLPAPPPLGEAEATKETKE